MVFSKGPNAYHEVTMEQESRSLLPPDHDAKVRMAFTVAYDGRGFHGWQYQPSVSSVQGTIESAFERLLDLPVRIAGSGRTDTGVSAWGQVFHVDVDGTGRWTPETLRRAVNHFLPPEIRIVSVCVVAADFHARHDVRAKIYRYAFVSAPRLGHTPSPLSLPFLPFIPAPLDLTLMKTASRSFLGSRYYAHFTVQRSCPENPVRTVDGIHWEIAADSISFWVTGRGFLHMMIRYMVGGLIDVGAGRRTPGELEKLLVPGSDAPKVPIRPAPPEGLCLVRVLYGKKDPFYPY